MAPHGINDELVLVDEIPTDITHSIFNNVKKMRSADKDERWFKSLQDTIKYSRQMRDGFDLVGLSALTVLKLEWDVIPLDVRKKYGFTFIEIALLWYPEYASSTLYNYIEAVETWIFEDRGPDYLIPFVKRSDTGKPLIENGKPVVAYKEFDVLSVPIAKLVAAKAAVKRGAMTETAWQMLADPVYSRDQLAAELRPKSTDPIIGSRYHIEGPMIFVVEDGVEAFLAEISDEYDTDPLVKKHVNILLKCLGIELDEDAIVRITRNGLFKPYEDSGVQN
jgi:hypothetical protein